MALGFWNNGVYYPSRNVPGTGYSRRDAAADESYKHSITESAYNKREGERLADKSRSRNYRDQAIDYREGRDETRDRQWQSQFGLASKDQADKLKFSRDQFDYTKSRYAEQRDDRLAAGQAQTDIINTGYGAMLTAWNKNTGQQAADIRSDFNSKQASGMQALARTGMSNTTIAPTMKLGYEREKQAQLNRNADSNLKTKLGILEGQTSALSNVATGYEQGA